MKKLKFAILFVFVLTGFFSALAEKIDGLHYVFYEDYAQLNCLKDFNYDGTHLEVPESVFSVYKNAEYPVRRISIHDCPNLVSITLPSSIDKIYNTHIDRNPNLREVIILGKPEAHFFDTDPNITFFVPEYNLEWFQNDPTWSKVKIKGIEPYSGVKITPVDMGTDLDDCCVQWASADIGAPNASSPGKLYSLTENIWLRLPTEWGYPDKEEFELLFKNTTGQLMLTPSGIPSNLQLTSKSTGNNLNLYFGKNSWKNNGNLVSNPMDGSYVKFYNCSDEYILGVISGKLPEQARSAVMQYLKAAGVTSTNVADWPNEVKGLVKQNIGENVYFDKDFRWFCTFTFLELGDIDVDATECYILPCFYPDDDE